MNVVSKVGISVAASAVGGGLASAVTESANEDAGLWTLSWLSTGGAVAAVASTKGTAAGLGAGALAIGAAIGAYSLGRVVID